MWKSDLILRPPLVGSGYEVVKWKISIFLSWRGLLCDARPLIRIHNMGSSYLDTEKITQYGWSGTTSTQTANILSLSSARFNCLRADLAWW